MKYKSSDSDDNYYVPIVVKNKDTLIGYVNGITFVKEIVSQNLQESDFYVDFKGLDLGLDSTRFNDILDNGIRLSDMSKDEYKNYVKDKIATKMSKMKNEHPDETLNFKPFIYVECTCGFGFYSFKTPDEVPNDGFCCVECGKKLIDFTNYSDEEFEYDDNYIKEEKML